ncbi:MAG: RNA-binding protein [Chloroflexi bacterium]|nr:RNA-binding protein [Chloroflexota bacterium]
MYVGNLPYEISEQDLRRLFAQAGTVEDVVIPTERETGRPRGFAFVELANDQEAEEAVRTFDGYTLQGRSLRVNLAQERERGYGRGRQSAA